MSNFGSRSTQRSAISTSSASESAVVSFVHRRHRHSAPFYETREGCRSGRPEVPRHRCQGGRGVHSGDGREAIDRRSFLLATASGVAGLAVAAGLSPAAPSGAAGPAMPHGSPRGRPVRSGRARVVARGHRCVRRWRPRHAVAPAPLQPEVRRPRAARASPTAPPPSDVARTIAFARAHGYRLAVRAGGHSYAGYSSGTGRLVVDVTSMAGVVRGRRRRRHRARRGGGAAHRRLQHARSRRPAGAGRLVPDRRGRGAHLGRRRRRVRPTLRARVGQRGRPHRRHGRRRRPPLLAHREPLALLGVPRRRRRQLRRRHLLRVHDPPDARGHPVHLRLRLGRGPRRPRRLAALDRGASTTPCGRTASC